MSMHMAPQDSNRLQALIALLVCLALFSSLAAAQDTPVKPIVHNIREIGKVLGACMQPLKLREPYPGMSVTVRLGFNSRGQPLGPPRFTYMTPNAPDRTKADYKTAISNALKRCTPLSFSRQLGATIAGVPIILRFDERGLMEARLGGSSAFVAPVPLPSSTIPPAQPVPPITQPPTYQEAPIWLPGVANPIPNLPHGPETSQDRRARCVLQSGLYGVPLTNYTQYMGLCTQ
jgi:hypothetical protein